jgi:cellulose synthase/poly-beta-1,6-N-acetylglucosamine synthase-like glycosyltransferase
MLIEMIFWISAGFVFYAYFGYPIILMGISLLKNYPVKRDNITPKVSFIITEYNEEKRIKEKIENTLKQKYPQDKFEIIVASDCSHDKTDEIVKSYNFEGVKLVRAPERKGRKTLKICYRYCFWGNPRLFRRSNDSPAG